MPLSQHRTALMGLAALMVIVSHIAPYHDFIASSQLGAWGVDLFLIASGYGLASSLQRQAQQDPLGRISWKAYWHKRLVRIWPMYVLLATLVTLAHIPQLHGVWHFGYTLLLRITTLPFFVPQLCPTADNYLSMLPLFYALVPLLYGYIRRKTWWVVIGASLMTIVGILSYEHIQGQLHINYYYALCRIPSFLLGMGLAIRWPRLRWYLIVASVAFIAATTPHLPGILRATLCAPLLLIALLWGLNHTAATPYKLLSFLGHRSLPIYCANIVLLQFFGYCTQGIVAIDIALYLAFQVILTYIFTIAEHRFQAYWSIKHHAPHTS